MWRFIFVRNDLDNKDREMSDFARDTEIPFGPGLIAVTLGSIGTLLFFLPILGAPLSAAGLAVSIAAMLLAVFRGGTSLRWALAGFCVCASALALNLGLAFAPLWLVPGSAVQPSWQPLPDRPYASPPARPGRVFSKTSPVERRS
jgi:hypothetical protein